MNHSSLHRTPPALVALVACFTVWSVNTPLFAGKYSSGGGRSYSSGSRSSTSSSRSSSSFSGSRPSSTFGNKSSTPRPSYSAPRPSIPSPTTPGNPRTSSTFDSAARTAKSSTSSTPNLPQFSGNRSYPTQPGSNTARSFTTTGMNASALTNRTSSLGHLFSSALTSYMMRPRVIYRDRYGSPFSYWLMDQPRQDRAVWLYNHQSNIDPQRRNDMIAADPELDEAVKRISGTQDPNYVPPSLTSEDTLAESSLSQPAQTQEVAHTRTSYANRSGNMSATTQNGSLFWSVFGISSVFLLWLVFFKRWQYTLS